MEENNILVEDLCKQFDGFSLYHVSFRVPKGRIVGFIGENGAGKSTTINLILNELKPDGGHVQIFGMENTVPSVREHIGVVFDECNFPDVFTALDMEKVLSGIYKSWDSSNDYIIHRATNVCMECLVRDKDAVRRKYKDYVVDNATLEDIMLFYIKGGAA